MPTSTTYIPREMLACLKRYWGYTQFRPWQAETILAILDERETLTILPTGGGKSLTGPLCVGCAQRGSGQTLAAGGRGQASDGILEVHGDEVVKRGHKHIRE